LSDNTVNVSFVELEGARGPIARAVAAALEPRDTSLSASIANTLHDMKNQIVAARQANTVSSDTGRTQRLNRQHAASAHLDEAKVLARQLQVAGSLPRVTEGATELRTFLRSYCARLLDRLPVEFSVIPPGPHSPTTVSVDESSLAAILNNLVKNTQEALPSGATVTFEIGGDTKMAHVEMSDDGPGVPDDVVEALRSNRPVQSSKIRGNGLGLVGVRNLIRRVGGSLEYVTGRNGACWRISLPTLVRDIAEDGS
jgi:C4-dicarboxylate-specific signal transduction histidine kinase